MDEKSRSDNLRSSSVKQFLSFISIAYLAQADVSPPDIESTTIALLISAYNIAEQLSNVLGANLYTYTFAESFPKLIAVSALATLACVLLVPLLPQKPAHS